MTLQLALESPQPATSIADVIPGSIARGETVQPGDRIVFAGNRNQTPQQAAGAAQQQQQQAPAPQGQQQPPAETVPAQ